MHVPSGKTQDIEILTFKDACNMAPDRAYDKEKWLYVPPCYGEYRYILGTKGENPLICIGINPSTAEPDNLDNTLKSVERIAAANGYDSFIMFNVYPQRATDPDHMDHEANGKLCAENLKAFEYILSLYGTGHRPAVWASWGTIIEKRDYLPKLVEDMIKIGLKYNAVWYSVGPISKKGHPHHPLYLRKDACVEEFDIEGYVKMLSDRNKGEKCRQRRAV